MVFFKVGEGVMIYFGWKRGKIEKRRKRRNVDQRGEKRRKGKERGEKKEKRRKDRKGKEGTEKKCQINQDR